MPLANLRPTVEGRCSEECDDSCTNLHANSTPYWQRGWCRAEVEWSSPTIQDISYGLPVDNFAFLLLVSMIVGSVSVPLAAFLQNHCAHPWLFYCAFFGCYGAVGWIEPCIRGLAGFATRKNPGTNGCWPRSRLALSADEFQEQVRTEGIAFTHRSDFSQVVALQEEVYKQKLIATKGLSLSRLSRDDRHKLPGILLENSVLTEVVLRATYFQETDVEALTNALREKALQILQLESVPLSSRSFGQFCSALGQPLRILVFSGCSLGDAEMSLLAESLGALQLEELGLSYNKIGDAGAMNLAEALSSHPTLKCLDLSGNRIGNVGASALAEALMVNDAFMEKLDLRGNWVGACQLRHRPHQEIQIVYHDERSQTMSERVCAVIFVLLYLKWLSALDRILRILHLERSLPEMVWLMLVISPWVLGCILLCLASRVCPSLHVWCASCTGYIFEVSKKLADWSLVFHDRLESFWAAVSGSHHDEVQEDSSFSEPSSLDSEPFLTCF